MQEQGTIELTNKGEVGFRLSNLLKIRFGFFRQMTIPQSKCLQRLILFQHSNQRLNSRIAERKILVQNQFLQRAVSVGQCIAQHLNSAITDAIIREIQRQ